MRNAYKIGANSSILGQERNKMAGSGLPYKPRIFKQGLALVLIPLSLGTCVLLFLNQVWLSAEKVAQEETRQSRIVEQLTDLLVSWSILSSSSIVGAVERDWQAVVKKEHPWLWFRFYELKQTTKDQPEALARVLRLEQISHDEIEACSTLPKSNEGLTLELVLQLPKTLARVYQLRTEVKRNLAFEQVELERVREKQKRSFQSMKLYAYAFAAGNLVLAMLIVWLFSRSISDRIRVLADNAAALPRLPKKRLVGNDELAYLDKVLNETAESLQSAAEHRRSVLGMVAHDMRSPLMSSQVSIQMIEEIGGDYSVEAYQSLEAAGNHLGSILTFVQDLLTVQKAEDADENSSLIESTPLPANAPSSNKDKETQAKGIISDFLMRPKIFHKGMLVTLSPLALQICFLLFINNQLINTENLAKGEQRCNDINIASSIIKMDMIRGSTSRGIYLLTSSPTAEKLANKIFDEIAKEYDKLSEVVGSDQEWQKYIKLAKATHEHQLSKIMSLLPTSEPAEKWAAFEEISELKQRSAEAFESRTLGNALLKKDVEDLHAMAAQQKKLAELISNLIGFGILANFLLAFSMLYVFTKNITDRIVMLAVNAIRIRSGEELKENKAGTDELAYLGLLLHQAKSQLDMASQQRALMMASLAQQMRVPLQSAKASLHQFYEITGKSMQDVAGKQLTRAQNNIDRVLRLVDDLLTMESLESGKVTLELSDCEVHSIAEDAIATVAGLAKNKSIILLNECASIKIRADKSRLVQVLINYLSNAIKFSPAQTQISVSTIQSSAEKVKVLVTDQGPGMDAETRDRVFEKFFQANTAEKKQGFGLGLAICQLIVHSHQGSLGVDSEPGKGSSFWFEIPMNQASQEDA